MATNVRFHHESSKCVIPIETHYKLPAVRGKVGILILETEPQSRSIYVAGRHKPVIRATFPYLLHIIQYYKLDDGKYMYPGLYGGGLHVFLNTKPLKKVGDDICLSPTDTDSLGLVCTPHEYDQMSRKSLYELASEVVGIWWGAYHYSSGHDNKWENLGKPVTPEESCKLDWGKHAKLRAALTEYSSCKLPKRVGLVNKPFVKETFEP